MRLAFSLLSLTALSCSPSNKVVTPPTDWKLVWADEFEGPAGTPVDSTKWSFDVGGDGWGNQQLEYDSDSTDNVALDGEGNLVITALRQSIGTNTFTSGRIKTKGLFAQQHGRIEASIKLPAGRGLWPAFWMLGANIDSTPWPQCGEIDILEQRGQEPSVAVGSLHGPGYSGGAAISARHRLEGGGAFSDDFHRFAVEWDPTRIAFFVDDTVYQVVTADEVLARGAWVYDHPFFVILNLAVGGNFVGAPDAQTPFPAQLKVAWVHVSQRTP